MGILDVTISMKVIFLTNNWVSCYIYNIYCLWAYVKNSVVFVDVNSTMVFSLVFKCCAMVVKRNTKKLLCFVLVVFCGRNTKHVFVC